MCVLCVSKWPCALFYWKEKQKQHPVFYNVKWFNREKSYLIFHLSENKWRIKEKTFKFYI